MTARAALRAVPRAVVRAGVGRRARLRWVHLVLGGALLMPFHLLTGTLVAMVGVFDGTPGSAYTLQLASLVLDVPLLALAGLVPLVRTLEGSAARVLVDASGEILGGPTDTWPARRRTSAWFTLHTVLGGIVAGMSIAAPPAGVLLLALPFAPDLLDDGKRGLEWLHFADAWPAVGAALGLLLFALPVAASAAAGAWLARSAPVLLGPTPADRLALAEQRAERMAERTRLARDLHDSVGHALSAVTLQASAAGRLLERDPAFVAQALAAIEDTARAAVAELDHVLGLLREEGDASRAPAPSLAELPDLVARTRAAGAEVVLDTGGTDVAALPTLVSREAYRIVQEGLGNALRHAGAVPIDVRIAVEHGELRIAVSNPAPEGKAAFARRRGGGRGLRGAAERVAVLRGRFDAGARDGHWRLTADIPLGGTA
ncbi:sensor histidine kinase [Yinghuangia seranimata]|uniref:sensor histidine kinase n=1 Tax=Yinghuangia seranimata TaxID=408067 RepID=UPI00248C6B9A|nr:histidine kinase [Yinghuangia seranimata]MDI2130650.1 histidine kinase [Yinghuangia seranimata]